MLIFDVSNEIWNLIANDLGQILRIYVLVEVSKILSVMIFKKQMPLFFNFSGVGRKKIKSKKLVIYFLAVFLFFRGLLLIVLKIAT